MPKSLSPRLAEIKAEVEGYARGFGLDFFDTIFEVLSYEELNMVASYGGFPTRYPHWRWGMEYEQLSKSYEYGLSKIYELVINNEPTYAYGTSSFGTTPADLSNHSTTLDKFGLYFGYWNTATTSFPKNTIQESGLVRATDLATAQSMLP